MNPFYAQQLLRRESCAQGRRCPRRCVCSHRSPRRSRRSASTATSSAARSRTTSRRSRSSASFISSTWASRVRVLNQLNTQVVLLTAMRLARSHTHPLSHTARAQGAAAQLRRHLHLKSKTTQLRSKKKEGGPRRLKTPLPPTPSPLPEKANTRRLGAAKKANTRRREI